MVELAKYAKQHVPEEHPKVSWGVSHPLRVCRLIRWWANEWLPSAFPSGRPFLRGEESEEAAGCRRGLRPGVYGQAGESGPHRGLQGEHRQVGRRQEVLPAPLGCSLQALFSPQGLPGSGGAAGGQRHGGGSGRREGEAGEMERHGLEVDLVHAELCPPQALIPLASDNTGAGKVKAAQALAKISITSNPQIAFPGERVRTASRKILLV